MLLYGRYREFPKYFTNLQIIGQNSGLTLSSLQTLILDLRENVIFRIFPMFLIKLRLFTNIYRNITTVQRLQLHDGGFRSTFEIVSFLTVVIKTCLHVHQTHYTDIGQNMPCNN
jgi:hypothetical protein